MRTPKKRMSQEVADGILENLRSGEYAPGNQIPTENELVEIFNVSRTAVREGVKSLVALGVLETRRGIGTFVCHDSPGPLRYLDSGTHKEKRAFQNDLLEFRMIVEPETAAFAAQRRSDEDLDELKRCVEVLESFLSSPNIPNGKPAEDLGFHLHLREQLRTVPWLTHLV